MNFLSLPLTDGYGVFRIRSHEDTITVTFQNVTSEGTHVFIVFRQKNRFCAGKLLVADSLRIRRGVLIDAREVDLQSRPKSRFAIDPNAAAGLFDDAIDC